MCLHSGDIFKNKNFLSYISKKLHNFDLICGNIVFKKKNKIIRLWNFKINNFNKYNFLNCTLHYLLKENLKIKINTIQNIRFVLIQAF